MTWNKIFYFILPLILIIGIYGTHTSYEKSGYFEPYSIKNSNNIMTISIDNSTYKQGQTISFSGNVNHYGQGVSVVLQMIDPSGNIVDEFHAGVDRYGVFVGFYTIPDTFPSGKYVLKARYEGDLKNTILPININIFGALTESRILIPLGASSESDKLNFVPQNDIFTEGKKVMFINNDLTVHTVISGKISANGTLLPDGLFQGGFVTPGSKLVASLKPGNYTYFCKLHPWLGGKISVKPIKVPTKPSAKPSIKSSKPATVPDSVLQSIWKERKDLQKLYPEAPKGNLTGLKKWAAITGWTQYDSLSALTPPTKTTSKSNMTTATVPDSVLQAIWKERKDLQKLYPEAAKGNLTGLKKWASSTGWNEDKRLSALIPQGKVPAYLNSVLQSIWKERKDLQKLYPEAAKGNLVNMSKWAVTTGYTQYDNLSALSTPIKTK